MKISVLLFGILKDIIGENTVSIEVVSPSNIKDVKLQFLKKYPKLIAYQNFSVAVNEAYENDSYNIKENDVLALIPPVSGG